jgi:hypothetical protein
LGGHCCAATPAVAPPVCSSMLQPHCMQTTNFITFDYDHWSLFLHDAELDFAAPENDHVIAIDAAKSGIGRAGGLVNLGAPAQWHFGAPLILEIWSDTPDLDIDDWDHVVEFDLDVRSGRLALAASGSGPGDETLVSLPAGYHRARWSGRGFENAREAAYRDEPRPDSYRLQVWPRTTSSPDVGHKVWPWCAGATGADR